MNKEIAQAKFDRMTQQTIGVEVEMNNIRRDQAAKLAAEYFGTGRYEFIGQGCYKIWGAYDQEGRCWKFERDASITGPEDEKCEMVTPILTYKDMELLQGLIRVLRKAGAKSNPDIDCGVHIHIGAQGHTPKTLRNLVNIMASHEDLLAKAINIDQYRLSRWCKAVDPMFLKEINAKKPATMDDLADVWYRSQFADYCRSAHYNESRYHMLNLHATFTKGTVEFRMFQFEKPADGKQNGLHAGQLKAYIQLCLAMSQLAKDVANASAKPQQNENEKFAMRGWMLRLGFIGDEFKTARDLFMKRLSGDSGRRREVA